jgi:hypothetical protein
VVEQDIKKMARVAIEATMPGDNLYLSNDVVVRTVGDINKTVGDISRRHHRASSRDA